MTRDELLAYCRNLYQQKGLEALSYPHLKKIKGLYWNLYSKGINQRKLIDELDLKDEFDKNKGDFFTRNYNGEKRKGWTWERIIKTAKEVQEKQGFLPPAGWFQQNGHGSLVQAVYYLGYDWEKIRNELGDFSNSSFVESRNGMRWRSHPEASLSNFLYARGVEHKLGERYPDEYAKNSISNYGYYDMHFLDKSCKWVDVEIWGDKPYGHSEEHYKRKREDKESFNSNNLYFLGIHYDECYNEQSLKVILKSYIGDITPFQFDRPTDKIIPATHWSNADELLIYCKEFVSQMPDRKFPTEEWLRKRGKWSKREGEAYNTLAVYIKTWLGGIRKLRQLLEQENFSTKEWDRNKAICAYKEFYEMHNLTPSQARNLYRKGSKEISAEVSKEAACIDSAISKYAGGVKAVNQTLGIKVERPKKWTKDKIIQGYKTIIDKWNISPNQLMNDHRIKKLSLPESEYRELSRLIDAASREFGGSKQIMKILNFKPPSRKRRT